MVDNISNGILLRWQPNRYSLTRDVQRWLPIRLSYCHIFAKSFLLKVMVLTWIILRRSGCLLSGTATLPHTKQYFFQLHMSTESFCNERNFVMTYFFSKLHDIKIV